MNPTRTLTLILTTLAPLTATAQLAVVESSGAAVSDKTTNVAIRSPSGGPVEIFEVLAKSRSVVAAYGVGGAVTGSGMGQTVRRICVAPCSLELKGGVYTLQVSDNLFFADEFVIHSDGIDKTFEVEDYNAFGAITGMLLAIFGTSGAISAPLVGLILDDVDTAPLLAIGVGSAIAGLAGWIWMFASTADAEQI